MLIILSPAKTLDFESPVKTAAETTPDLIDDAAELVATLKKKSVKQLKNLMSVSDSLAELNYQRYQDWELPMPAEASRPAVMAFKGEVYLGLAAEKFTGKQLAYAQEHLRILSGLYGVLRPLDAILPYRLEMASALKTPRGKDLYGFWGSRLTERINDQLDATGSTSLLNLASNEYFRSLQPKALAADVITPVFKDMSNGKYRVVSFFAKKARGAMASWVIRHRVRTAKRLTKFDGDGYRYDPDSSSELAPVFLRG